jgi:hypothetical protein
MNERFLRSRTLRVAASIAVSAVFFSINTVQAQTKYASTTGWGTYYKPFAVDSPWNSRPVKPVLGTYPIKKPLYNPSWIPSIANGAYSLTVYMAKAGDPAMTVYGKAGQSGVNDPDSGQFRNVTLPRWPANVVPASGNDGHADIVDTETGIVHSFFQLQKVNGKWTASMYAWSAVDGKGWGDGAHWSQGARASGVPSSGGLIRQHEINDNKWNYEHALAMSLPAHTLGNGVSAPAYTYPATTADGSAASNTGAIPLGALIMLPPSFNTATITNIRLRKIAETLKLYGAYVVDRNYDTPFAIFVESGTNFTLMPNGWDGKVVTDLEAIRAALRQVVGAESWVAGDGKARRDAGPGPMLSMRGVWQYPTGGLAPGLFDTWQQAVSFPYTTKKITQINYANLSKVSWGRPAPGASVRFTSAAAGGATIRLQVKVAGAVVIDTGYLVNGAWSSFAWPKAAANTVTVAVLAESGVNVASSARGVLTVN